MQFGGPFSQTTAGASFAANPFVSATASQTAEDRFDSEFERFKATVLHVSKQSQENDTTADAQVQKIKDKNTNTKFEGISIQEQDPAAADETDMVCLY